MKTVLTGIAIAALSAFPALAHDQEETPGNPKMCEMMHGGQKMQGMMMEGADGKISCQMMDHLKMDHSKMDHGKKPAVNDGKTEAAASHKHDHRKSSKHD